MTVNTISVTRQRVSLRIPTPGASVQMKTASSFSAISISAVKSIYIILRTLTTTSTVVVLHNISSTPVSGACQDGQSSPGTPDLLRTASAPHPPVSVFPAILQSQHLQKL